MIHSFLRRNVFHWSKVLVVCMGAGFFWLGCGELAKARPDNEPETIAEEQADLLRRVPEVKVALLGDTGAGTNFASVLRLVASEKAQVVMINGDLGYAASPGDWKRRVDSSIDTDSHLLIGALGNHDVDGSGGSSADSYVAIFNSFRSEKNGLTRACTGGTRIENGRDTVAVDEVCTFGNVSIIPNGIGQVLSRSYLENRLEEKLARAPGANWKLVGYHYTLASMNPGIKSDQASFRFFDLIRTYGAIGAQAHTHSVMATCPISSPFAKGAPVRCHPEFGGNLEDRYVAPGVGLFLDSSLGGIQARNRGRCKQPNDPGCSHMIDIVSREGYTRTDGVRKSSFNRYGALFLVFNAGGDPRRAYGYYKSVDGQEVFRFNVSR